MTNHHDVVAAFADDEPVDAGALDAALADPSARAHLIDILVLRGLVGGALQPSPVAAPVGPRALARNGHATDLSRRMPRGVWLSAAAALMAVGLAAGFAVGRRVPGPATDQPAAANAAASDAISPESAPAGTSAPRPTHVIRFERGVDWNERSGGN
jgi:hypothetical protein